MILRHFADTLVFATNSGTTCNEVRSVETHVKEPDEWNQAQNKTNQNLSNEVLFFSEKPPTKTFQPQIAVTACKTHVLKQMYMRTMW